MKNKSNKSLEPDISDIITKIKDIGGDRIKFIVLYGSAAKVRTLSKLDEMIKYAEELQSTLPDQEEYQQDI